MGYFEKAVNCLSRWLEKIAQGAMVLMTLLVCANIILRLFGQPIVGTYEFVMLLGVVLSLGLAHCAVMKGHVFIGVVLERFSQRTQAIINSITNVLAIGIFALAAKQCTIHATDTWHSGTVSPTMYLPAYILIYVLAFSCLMMCLVLLVNLFGAIRGVICK